MEVIHINCDLSVTLISYIWGLVNHVCPQLHVLFCIIPTLMTTSGGGGFWFLFVVEYFTLGSLPPKKAAGWE